MAITTAVCVQYKTDCHNGVHQPGHTYKLALYTSAATLGATTTAYTASGEVSGTGYTAGGVALTGRTVTTNGTAVDLDFTDPVWPTATITGARGCLIYNDSAAGKPAIAVIDFGADKSSSGAAFTVDLVPPTVRIA